MLPGIYTESISPNLSFHANYLVSGLHHVHDANGVFYTINPAHNDYVGLPLARREKIEAGFEAYLHTLTPLPKGVPLNHNEIVVDDIEFMMPCKHKLYTTFHEGYRTSLKSRFCEARDRGIFILRDDEFNIRLI